MTIKDSGTEFVTKIHNELVQIRANQIELGQELTERINDVANRVKKLDSRMEARFDAVDKRLGALETTQDSILATLESMQSRQDSMEFSQKSMLATLDSVQSHQESMETAQQQMLSILLTIQRKLDVN
ncbi:hypothetical protein [Nonomuraea rubra]|uniref:hypothetical protein n=1 Tax=Nonomuraea rubra TaxID=46180 RepID=UPI0033CF8834